MAKPSVVPSAVELPNGVWGISRCCGRDVDPVSAHLRETLEFLLRQFQDVKQYRTINGLRSAISMMHDDIHGTRVGQHPMVTQFFKGVFNSRPPKPRYGAT